MIKRTALITCSPAPSFRWSCFAFSRPHPTLCLYRLRYRLAKCILLGYCLNLHYHWRWSRLPWRSKLGHSQGCCELSRMRNRNGSRRSCRSFPGCPSVSCYSYCNCCNKSCFRMYRWCVEVAWRCDTRRTAWGRSLRARRQSRCMMASAQARGRETRGSAAAYGFCFSWTAWRPVDKKELH